MVVVLLTSSEQRPGFDANILQHTRLSPITKNRLSLITKHYPVPNAYHAAVATSCSRELRKTTKPPSSLLDSKGRFATAMQ